MNNQAQNQVIATLENNIVELKKAIIENNKGYIVIVYTDMGLRFDGNKAFPGSMTTATRFTSKEEAHLAMETFKGQGEYKVKSAALAMLQEINTTKKLIKEINK